MKNTEIYRKEYAERALLKGTYKFRSTNRIWNDLRLNNSYCIGYLTKLIKENAFQTPEEWIEYYYKSGEQRLLLLENVPIDIKNTLNNFIAPITDPGQVKLLKKKDKDMNQYYGRTEAELDSIGKYMYKMIVLKGNSLDITERECIDYIKIRVLDEIIIGYQREKRTKEKLIKLFPTYEFKEVDIITDTRYAIDLIVYKNKKPIAAIQVKSKYYNINNSSQLRFIKNVNLRKNNNYTRYTGIKVLTIYSSEDGFIYNLKVLNFLKSRKAPGKEKTDRKNICLFIYIMDNLYVLL